MGANRGFLKGLSVKYKIRIYKLDFVKLIFPIIAKVEMTELRNSLYFIEWKIIFASYLPDKGLISRTFEKLKTIVLATFMSPDLSF